MFVGVAEEHYRSALHDYTMATNPSIKRQILANWVEAGCKANPGQDVICIVHYIGFMFVWAAQQNEHEHHAHLNT